MGSETENNPQSFADTLQAHLRQWRSGVDGSTRRDWNHWAEGIYPGYRELALEVVQEDSVRLHRYSAHIRSSQVFAFNLFLPFRRGSRDELSSRVGRSIGTDMSIDDISFEWVPPGDLLGELYGDRPVGNEHATGVDVVLWCRTASGPRCSVLIEVKLSELDFTHCNGRTSSANRRLDVCDSAVLFFEEPSACYLRRPAHQRRDRRYWEIFAGDRGSVSRAFPGADRAGPCPFAFGMQQPMRNLAIARGLEQDELWEISRAWFVLCAHDHNPDIGKRWIAWRQMLPDPSMAPSLPASRVVDAGEAEGLTEWAAWMRKRYLL